MATIIYFRSHVIRCAAEGVGRPVEIDLQLAHAEIGDADVAFVVEQNVVQLQISALTVIRSAHFISRYTRIYAHIMLQI